ncbi:unnamed protein product [Trichobilharzia regenti]|nr:unnamed protein product [Trichobilharzia regenti]
MNCEEVTKISDKLSVKSASSSSDYELCDDNGAVKKPVVATGEPLLNGVSQTAPQFVREKGVTVSESSSDSTSLQGITSQSKEFENDVVDQVDDGKSNICDNDRDTVLLSLADHDAMNGMPTTAEFNKGSVRREREVELSMTSDVSHASLMIMTSWFP